LDLYSRETWAEIERLLDQALDLAPDRRPAFLEQASSITPALGAEIERLLHATEASEGYLGEPAPTYAASLVAWAAEPPPIRPGMHFGAYEVMHLLGRGGMATVYLAHDHKHHRQVAIKVLHAELAAAVGPEWFLREIDIAAALHHPHILPLHDSGTADGRLYYVMPYVEGESLRARLTRDGPFPLEQAIRIAQDVAGALAYAHRQKVVHRDIKPENILLQDEQAIVADFGIARAINAAGAEKLTEPSRGIGTPAYMSPEQAASGAVIDGRADIYALGCVTYEMLAGQPPFPGDTVGQILGRHAEDPVPSLDLLRPALPVHVARAIERALQKAPADRFATAGEFAKALEIPPSAGMSERAPSGSRLRRLSLAAAIVTLALVAGLVTWGRTPGAVTSKPGLVAVLPFRTTGATPDLAWLHEGMLDLLAADLTGGDVLRAAEPSAVLSAWRRRAGSADESPTPESALEVGRSLGASRVVDGSVVGTAGHLTLTASLIATSDGRQVARASTEGPGDSLPSLVNRLAARLLSLGAGVDASRLTSTTSSSLPALRAYLLGRTAFRRGRLKDAFQQFREATLLDSTFSLAALELLHTSIWVDFNGEDAQRGRRLAQAGRAHLGSGDQALLDARAGPHPTGPELFHRWQAATNAYPDRPETWYGLGDAYYHWGLLAGLDDPFRLAAEAFRRGWAVDSASASDSVAPERSPIFAEPLMHMVEIAQMNGDTGSVRRLVGEGLAADSASQQSWYLRWHRAVALGDSARRAFWADWQRIDPGAFGQIMGFTEWTGVGAEDYVRATNLIIRHTEAGDPPAAAFYRFWAAMNGGRPHEALLLLNRSGDLSGMASTQGIYDALYWGADTASAIDGARRLVPDGKNARFAGATGAKRLGGLIALAEWRAARGDYAFAETAGRRLRTARIAGRPVNDSIELTHYASLNSSLLEATRATALRLPEASAMLEQADSAARTHVIVLHSGPPANLVIARLAETQGDLPLALRAVRRRMVGFELGPWYLSTFLREEGRLAALVGDTAGAVRAYRHYLALRPDPEPADRPEVEQVRAQLVRLVGGHAKAERPPHLPPP
jgi:TolB-like protein